MEECLYLVKVFIPDDKFNHMAYYYYDANKLGRLDFGDVVITNLGVGMIIEYAPDEYEPNFNVKDIICKADDKDIKKFNKNWWNDILYIHEILKSKSK